MTHPRYPAYKDSGVAWLGQVPKHWVLRSLRYAATIQNGSDFKDHEVLEGGYPVLGSGGEFARISKFIYDKPTVLLGRKGTIDNPLYTEEPFWTVDTLFYTKIAADTWPKFFYWFCRTIPFDYFQFGSAVPSMTQNDLYGIKVPTPPLPEQQAIAQFLDIETAKIDALISEQEALIRLLKEKRQAVISHAVTKGLNPKAKLRESGVAWLGEVPKHWEVKRLKYLGDAFIGLIYDPAEVVNEDEGVLVLRSSNVQNGAIAYDDNVYVKKDIPEKAITKVGDILICSRNGSRALIGKNARIDDVAAGCAFGAFMTIFRSKFNNYLSWVFKSQLFEFQSGAFLTSTINQLTISNLYGFEIPMPPTNEQIAIAQFLDTETAKLDTLTTEALRAIELLRERRTALISAAVTGKMDVRAATM